VNAFRRYPEYAKPVMLASAVLFGLCFVAASFVKKVCLPLSLSKLERPINVLPQLQIEHLILLQAVLGGVLGAILYTVS